MNNRIKQLREEYRMTQIRLSTELEVSQETISAYESGKHYPSVTSLICLSQIFHTSCDYILGLSDVRNCFNFSNINDDEQLLLEQYKNLPPHKQERLMSYLLGLVEK